MSDMHNIWDRFENWLTHHASHLVEDLNPPASKEAIEKVESTLGVPLPRIYVEFLSIHNGQDQDAEYLIYMEELLSTERIVDEWTVWKDLLDGGDFRGIESEPAQGIKNDWWNVKWIPITYDGAGNHYCIDLDPAEGGKKGQIIRMWHDTPERELIALSFEEWISTYVDMLEKGVYTYSKDYGGLIHVDDL